MAFLPEFAVPELRLGMQGVHNFGKLSKAKAGDDFGTAWAAQALLQEINTGKQGHARVLRSVLLVPECLQTSGSLRATGFFTCRAPAPAPPQASRLSNPRLWQQL